MVISGGSKGNGVLKVIGDSEGLDTTKHLLIEGGVINIAAQMTVLIQIWIMVL